MLAGRAAIKQLASAVTTIRSDEEAHSKSALREFGDSHLRSLRNWLDDRQFDIVAGKQGAMVEFDSLSFGETYVTLTRAPMPANLTIGSGPSRTTYDQRFLSNVWPKLLEHAAREVLGRRGLTLEETLEETLK